jgi:hypothetical protein
MNTNDALKLKIKANRREIFELDVAIDKNRSKIDAVRSATERDGASIARNYTSALYGNHQLTNKNTDEIFKNRVAILDNMEVSGEVEVNFRETMINMANIDFFSHRAEINADIIEINSKLAEVNTKLTEINQLIMERNEKSVNFNRENLATNKRFLSGEFHPSKASEQANVKRAQGNSDRCEKLKLTTKENLSAIETLGTLGAGNSANVLKNSVEIARRRNLINENQEAIIADQQLIAQTVFE